MGFSVTQTDNVEALAWWTCYTPPDGYSDNWIRNYAERDATAGTTEHLIGVTKADTEIGVGFTTEQIWETAWPTGNITFRLDVTTPNADIDVVAVYACKVTNGGTSPTTYGSWTGTRTLSTQQVEEFTISCSSLTATSGDRIRFVVVFDHTGHADSSVGITPSQDIDLPISYIHLASADLAAYATMGEQVRYIALSSETPASADYVTEMLMTAENPTGLEQHRMGCIVRATNNNGYIAGYDGGASRWYIGKLVSGAITDLDTYSEAFPVDGDAVVQFDVTSTALTLTVDGVEKCSTTDSTYTSAGSIGLFANKVVDSVVHTNTIKLQRWGVLGTPAQNPAAALSASATLTASGSVAAIHTAAASLAGSASVVITATNEQQAALAITGTAALTADGSLTLQAAAALDASATLVATGSITKEGSAALDASATLAAAGAVDRNASVALDGSATLVATGSADRNAVAALAGTASVVASGNTGTTHYAAVAMDASATLAAAAVETYAAAVTLDASGFQFASGVAMRYAYASLPASATVASQGSMTLGAATALDGAATLGAIPSATRPGAAALTGTATLSATGSTAGLHLAQASLAGSASITLDASLTLGASLALSGSALAVFTGTYEHHASLTLNGVALTTQIGFLTFGAVVDMPASATVTFTATNEQQASTALTGTATLTPNASIGGIQTANADLTGTATLGATGSLVLAAASALDSTAQLSPTAVALLSGSTALLGTATFDATPSAVRGAVSLQAGSATLNAQAVVDHDASTTLDGTAAVDAKPSADWAAQATVITNSALAAVESDLVAWDTFSETLQTLLVDHTGEYGTWGPSSGNLALQIDTNGKLRIDL